MLALVPLTALYRHVVTEHVTHGGTQAFRSVQHDQQSVWGAEAALLEVPQKRRAGALVLRARLHQPQHAFLASRRHAERHDHAIVGERLAVEHQHQPLAIVMATLVQLLQRARTEVNNPYSYCGCLLAA